MTRALSLLRDHRALVAILLLHQALFWAVALSNNPQATVTFDCVTGTMGTEVLKGFTFGLLDAYDGVLAGMFVAAVFATPVFALFGFTGFSVKLGAALFAVATLLATYAFLHRIGGRLAGALGTATLAFAPPIHFLASLILGNWHYTELVFDAVLGWMLVAACWPRPDDGRTRLGRLAARPAAFALAWGVVAGLALVNSFGTGIFLAAFWATAWVMLRGRLRLRHWALHGVGLVVGATPFWWKVLFYTPYGQAENVRKAPVPEEMTNVSIDLVKLADMFVEGGFGYGLHFQDVWGTPTGSPIASWSAGLVTLGLFAGWGLLMVRTGPSMARMFPALIPGRPAPSPLRTSPAVVPAGMGLVYFVAFLVSDMSLELLPWYLTNPRELGHAILTPWTMVLGISTGVVAASLLRQWRTGEVPPGEWEGPRGLAVPLAVAASACWLLVVGLDAAGMAAAVREGGALPGARSAFRGSCWDVHGFYMTPKLGLDIERADAYCGRYGPAAETECRRGATWALGYGSVDPFAEEDGRPLPEGGFGESCLALSPPWRGECLRGIGWSLQSAGEGGMTVHVQDTGRCEELPEPEDRAACWQGVGFPLGDHLHTVPERLMRALDDLPEERRADVAEGAALHLGRTYSSWAFIEQLCADWHEPYLDRCLRGARHSVGFRGDRDAVLAR